MDRQTKCTTLDPNHVLTVVLCLPQTEFNISAAAISIFSLAFMILGSLCLVGSCSGEGRRRDYLLKPAGMFFAFAGGFGKLNRPPVELIVLHATLVPNLNDDMIQMSNMAAFLLVLTLVALDRTKREK